MIVSSVEKFDLGDPESVLDWLEKVNSMGLSLPLEIMDQLLAEAPAVSRNTEEFHYLCGLYDGRFLHEELK